MSYHLNLILRSLKLPFFYFWKIYICQMIIALLLWVYDLSHDITLLSTFPEYDINEAVLSIMTGFVLAWSSQWVPEVEQDYATLPEYRDYHWFCRYSSSSVFGFPRCVFSFFQGIVSLCASYELEIPISPASLL